MDPKKEVLNIITVGELVLDPEGRAEFIWELEDGSDIREYDIDGDNRESMIRELERRGYVVRRGTMLDYTDDGIEFFERMRTQYNKGEILDLGRAYDQARDDLMSYGIDIDDLTKREN